MTRMAGALQILVLALNPIAWCDRASHLGVRRVLLYVCRTSSIGAQTFRLFCCYGEIEMTKLVNPALFLGLVFMGCAVAAPGPQNLRAHPSAKAAAAAAEKSHNVRVG